MSHVVNVTVSSKLELTPRVRQVCAMFDCPPDEKTARSWSGSVPIDEQPWQVGLIVGPSGAGKSTVMRALFGEPHVPRWEPGRAVIDQAAPGTSVEDVAAAFSSVGFSTIPAWLRPYDVLSNGEKFRVDLARALLEGGDLVVVDEFTSVVDRQVAQIGSHAVQKYVRRQPGKRFVAVGCHYDVIDWLQPDWILEPATMSFAWRSVQPRPKLDVTIRRVPYALWSMFAPYHYMSAEMHRSARCFAAFVGERPVCFAGLLPMPVSSGARKGEAIVRVSRLVTLPDWQGLGLAFVLAAQLGSAYSAIGKRLRTYPAHPPFVRTFQARAEWRQIKQLGEMAKRATGISGGDRPCAVFEYIGPALDRRQAERLLAHG